MEYRSRLLLVAQTFAEVQHLSLARVSTKVRNDGKFFDRIEKGAGCTVDTYELVMQWFSDRWPGGVAWPEGVDRPVPKPSDPESPSCG